MATSGDRCAVTVEIDPAGTAYTFTSKQMRALVKEKAAALVDKKTELAEDYLHGPKPRNGLYGFRLVKGQYTWYAVIHPTSPPGYYIARKYGTL